MSEFRTEALVLRTFDHGESDRLVRLYSQSHGRISAIAKGARRSRRRFPGTLELLNRLEVRVVDPPRASLMRLEGARLRHPFGGLAADLARFAVACQLVELLDRLTGENEANPSLYAFACGVLDVLEGETADRLLALLVFAKTLARLGYRPQLEGCVLCQTPQAEVAEVAFDVRHGGAVCLACADAASERVPARILRALDLGIRTPLRERAALRLAPGGVKLAEQLCERFFRFHVGLELRTMAFLRQVVPFTTGGAPSVDAASSAGDTRASPGTGL